MSEVGDRIRDTRLLRRLTQVQLSDATGLSQVTISNIERGVTESPKAAHVAAVAEALGVTTDCLIRGTDDPPERLVDDDAVIETNDPLAGLSDEDREMILALTDMIRQRRSQSGK